VIANCPSCGTHYKHAPPKMKARARCGRCDTTLDLTRFRPYRIVGPTAPTGEDARRATAHMPIGLDQPELAATIARNVKASASVPIASSAAALWADQDPLPSIPEVKFTGAFESSVPPLADEAMLPPADFDRYGDDELAPAGPSVSYGSEGRATTFALWLATGAMAGTGASWTAGGTTIEGLAVGVMLGALAGWGWLRWTSPK